VRLRRGGEEVVFELDRRANVWQAAGTTVEARGFAENVDRILSVRARAWLTPDEAVAVEPLARDRVEVEVVSVAGAALVFEVVLAEDGRELVFEDGQWAEIRPGLHERLVALF
jgi:hypothetical protein